MGPVFKYTENWLIMTEKIKTDVDDCIFFFLLLEVIPRMEKYGHQQVNKLKLSY